MACRMCLTFLNEQENIGTPISEFKPMIAMILPQLDLNLSSEPLICSECIELINTYAEFKKMSMENENKVKLYKYSYIEKDKRNHRLDIKQIFWHYNPDIELERSAVVCRICFQVILGGTEISLLKDNACSDVLKFAVPELALRLTAEPFCCQTCMQAATFLRNYKEKCIKVQNLLLMQQRLDGQLFTNNELAALAVNHFLTSDDANSAAVKTEDFLVTAGNHFLTPDDANTVVVKTEGQVTEEAFENEDSTVKIEHIENQTEETEAEAKPKKPKSVKKPIDDNRAAKFLETVRREYKPVETTRKIKDGKEVEEGEEIHRCPYCIYTSMVRDSVVRHMKYKHKVYEQELRFQCEYCAYQAAKAYDLKRHLQYAHSRKPKSKVKTVS